MGSVDNTKKIYLAKFSVRYNLLFIEKYTLILKEQVAFMAHENTKIITLRKAAYYSQNLVTYVNLIKSFLIHKTTRVPQFLNIIIMV